MNRSFGFGIDRLGFSGVRKRFRACAAGGRAEALWQQGRGAPPAAASPLLAVSRVFTPAVFGPGAEVVSGHLGREHLRDGGFSGPDPLSFLRPGAAVRRARRRTLGVPARGVGCAADRRPGAGRARPGAPPALGRRCSPPASPIRSGCHAPPPLAPTPPARGYRRAAGPRAPSACQRAAHRPASRRLSARRAARRCPATSRRRSRRT